MTSTIEKARVLEVRDSETGKTYVLPVTANHIRATDLARITDIHSTPLRSYDPAYLNTASCTSAITFIDGENGVLRYRGYNIEELARNSSFLEVAFLLIFGHLPSKAEFEHWNKEIMTHTFLHENLTAMMKTFRYDAHPMGMVISSLSAMSTFYPDANPALQGASLYSNDDKLVNTQIFRLLGKFPTICAAAYRHRMGRPYNLPNSNLSYTANFLFMMDRLSEDGYEPDPRLAKALDVMLILHADHELNCSTAAMRHIVSAGTDPITAVAAAAGALYGPLHGGASESTLRMLERIGSVANVPAFVERVKQKNELLMGFGHRVYRNYDPRAKIIKAIADEVFEICGRDELIDVAIALEQCALKDPYFIERKLYPNVDFYSGLIYKALGIPTDFFGVLFGLGRCAGWLAHWRESIHDKESKIARPRQWYVGEDERAYVPMLLRPVNATNPNLLVHRSTGTSRRQKTAQAQRSRLSFLSAKL